MASLLRDCSCARLPNPIVNLVGRLIMLLLIALGGALIGWYVVDLLNFEEATEDAQEKATTSGSLDQVKDIAVEHWRVIVGGFLVLVPTLFALFRWLFW